MKRVSLIRTALLLGPLAASSLLLRAADPVTDRFNQLDKDGDGRVSMAELDGSPMLKKLDLDGDGYVTMEETRQGMSRLREAITKRATPSAEDQGSQPLELVFKQLDRNNDGKLTKDELPREDWFNRLDTNRDGSVPIEEARGVIGNSVPRRLQPFPSGSSPVVKPDEASLKEQPQRLKASDHDVGRLVPDIALRTLKGESVTLSKLKGEKGLVLALFSASCPISNKLGAEYARLEKDCAAKKIAFVLVNAIPKDKPEDLQKFVDTHQLKALVVNDTGSLLLTTLTAATTTEAFLLDGARTLVYRGAVNDQYGLGYSKDTATKPFLRLAIEDLVQGRTIQLAATTAPGCALDLPHSGSIVAAPGVTYHGQVARIMQGNCVECHRAEGVGPFSLETFADVVEHAGMIRKQVERGAMPPWFAAKSDSASDTPWANDCSLSTRDKTELLAWLASDRPAGDPKDGPLPRKFAGAWTIGEPDAVFTLPRPIAIKAEGTMPYQTATVTTSFAEDRWVQAYETIPTAPQVVHHVIVRVHEKGTKVAHGGDEGREGYWAAYVPGNTHRVLPAGYAKRLPAGATISFQIHYTPNGKAVEDQLKIGMIFAKEPPQYEVKVAAVANPRLSIPAGASDHIVVHQQPVPTNMLFSAFMAHMHVRGKAFKYEVTYPDGKTETLLDIPRYDFNWQLAYDYKQPKFVPAGSVVKITAVYDNSTNNPANPDPTKIVRWGAQTFDEMMIGYIEHYVPVTTVKVAENGR